MYGKVSVLFKYFHDAHTTLAPNFALRYTESEMDVKIINPFLISCEDAFKNMFDMPPQHKDPYLLDPNAGHAWEISGLLGITGDYNGVVAFRLHKILADKMLERSGIEIVMESEREELAKQLVSEFTNIIAGNAASEIKRYKSIAPCCRCRKRSYAFVAENLPDRGYSVYDAVRTF